MFCFYLDIIFQEGREQLGQGGLLHGGVPLRGDARSSGAGPHSPGGGTGRGQYFENAQTLDVLFSINEKSNSFQNIHSWG